MNPAARQNIAYLAIAGSLCAGAHWLIVEPRIRDLQQARAEAAQLEGDLEAAKSLPQQIDTLIQAEKGIQLQAQAVSAASEPATNESVLFARVMDLGQRMGVRVDRLDGKPSNVVASASANTPATARPAAMVRYSIDARGEYASIARFIQAMQTELGYCRVSSVQFSPSDETGLLQASIESEHLAVDPSPLAAATPGPSDAPAPPSMTGGAQ